MFRFALAAALTFGVSSSAFAWGFKSSNDADAEVQRDGQKGDVPPPLRQAGPPPLPKAVLYHYAEGGVQKGPVDEAAMKALIAAGRVDRQTLVWSKGMADWQAAVKTDLASLFDAAPPKIPATEQWKRYMLGTWQRSDRAVRDGIAFTIDYEATYLADGTFSGIARFSAPDGYGGTFNTSQSVSGSWEIASGASDSFVLSSTSRDQGKARTTSTRLRRIDAETMTDIEKNTTVRRVR